MKVSKKLEIWKDSSSRGYGGSAGCPDAPSERAQSRVNAPARAAARGRAQRAESGGAHCGRNGHYLTLPYLTLPYLTLPYLYFTLLYFTLLYVTLLYSTLLHFTSLHFTLLTFLLYFTLPPVADLNFRRI